MAEEAGNGPEEFLSLDIFHFPMEFSAAALHTEDRSKTCSCEFAEQALSRAAVPSSRG